jgi:hypothetical protein
LQSAIPDAANERAEHALRGVLTAFSNDWSGRGFYKGASAAKSWSCSRRSIIKHKCHRHTGRSEAESQDPEGSQSNGGRDFKGSL